MTDSTQLNQSSNNRTDTVHSNHRLNTLLSHLATPDNETLYQFAQKQHLQHNTTHAHIDHIQQYMEHTYTKKPLIVTVTGAAGNIAYSLLWLIGTGSMFGHDQPVQLRLLEIPRMIKQLRAVINELQDSHLPLISTIIGTTDYKTAFIDCNVALLLGGKPKVPGIKRRQVLQANSHIFSAQGAALNAYAHKDVKVCVLATPALTNALICQTNAPDLPATNFTALTRLDCNRAKFQLALRIGCHIEQIKNVCIFGNGSKTQFPDISRAYINDYPVAGAQTPVRTAINNNEWLTNEFIVDIVERGHNIAKIKQKTTAASAAVATCLHIQNWLYDTPDNEFVSMAVKSDGSYNVPKDIFFSFPVTCKNGQYTIVSDIVIDEFGQQRLDATIKELEMERHESLH